MLYYGYCPSCDEGLSWQSGDIVDIMGNRCIICPNCGNYIIIPTVDINNSGYLEKNELSKNLNNPNLLVYAEEEDED